MITINMHVIAYDIIFTFINSYTIYVYTFLHIYRMYTLVLYQLTAGFLSDQQQISPMLLTSKLNFPYPTATMSWRVNACCVHEHTCMQSYTHTHTCTHTHTRTHTHTHTHTPTHTHMHKMNQCMISCIHVHKCMTKVV